MACRQKTSGSLCILRESSHTCCRAFKRLAPVFEAPGGRFTPSLRQPQGSKQIECLINSDGQEVIIEIADQGCGIDEALRDRIFERGVTSSASKDHGIGLWLVRSYVEQAGGSIVVENNIPFGTIFTLYIPLTRDEHHG